MALAKAKLQADILNALNDQSVKENNPAGARNDLAAKLATAIEAFVKSGVVTVAVGIPVATAGSATAQTGATTGAGTGVIN